MVEAPRIRITYEKIRYTKNKKIVKINGPTYNKWNINLEGYIISKWWFAGKYIYTYLIKENEKPYVIRTHMMMYGKIIVNDERQINPRLRPFLIIDLEDSNGDGKFINLKWYLAQIKLLDPECGTDEVKSNYVICSSKKSIEESTMMIKYDVSSEEFDYNLMIKHINDNFSVIKNDIAVDFLLNQEFFPGIGNILQQEALYRCKILPTKKVLEFGHEGIVCLITELKKIVAQLYQSYLDKIDAKPHKPILQIYHKSYCPLGHKTLTKYLGYHNRRTSWCPICQK